MILLKQKRYAALLVVLPARTFPTQRGSEAASQEEKNAIDRATHAAAGYKTYISSTSLLLHARRSVPLVPLVLGLIAAPSLHISAQYPKSETCGEAFQMRSTKTFQQPNQHDAELRLAVSRMHGVRPAYKGLEVP